MPRFQNFPEWIEIEKVAETCEFGDVHFIEKFYGDSSNGRGSTKNRIKNIKTAFLETAISRVKWRYWGDFPSMFRTKIETFSITEITVTPIIIGVAK